MQTLNDMMKDAQSKAQEFAAGMNYDTLVAKSQEVQDKIFDAYADALEANYKLVTASLEQMRSTFAIRK